MIYYAHVDNPYMDKIDFYLNITSGDKIPRVGDRVYATSDNGRTGRYMIITKVLGYTIFHKRLGFDWTFVSVDYQAEKI